jgi:hypothetical protein
VGLHGRGELWRLCGPHPRPLATGRAPTVHPPRARLLLEKLGKPKPMWSLLPAVTVAATSLAASASGSTAAAATVASTSRSGGGSGWPGRSGCSVADFGAVADNKTDGTKAFRAATKSGCSEILVPPGVWMT